MIKVDDGIYNFVDKKAKYFESEERRRRNRLYVTKNPMDVIIKRENGLFCVFKGMQLVKSFKEFENAQNFVHNLDQHTLDQYLLGVGDGPDISEL